MDKIMSEYVITVHFSYEIHQNRVISMSQSVCELLKFAPFHCSFIWGRVRAKLMSCYLFIFHMEPISSHNKSLKF